MGFNYGKEKSLFDKEWELLRQQYIKAGMLENAINDLYDFDWNWFKMRRIYQNHVQLLPEENFDDQNSEERTQLFKKYASLLTEFDEYSFSGRYDWVETLSNVKLGKELKKLTIEELELLTLIAIEGYSQREVADKMNCSQNAISKKILKIKKNIGNL